MNYKIITYLFLSSLAVNSCMAMVTASQSQNVSQASEQAKDLEVAVAAKIQDLLQQGLSVEQIVTLLEHKSSDQVVDEDDTLKWVGFGIGAVACGVAGWFLCKHMNQSVEAGQAEEERLVQEVLRVGDMLAHELARGNQLEAQLQDERRAREVLVAQNRQNEAIIQGLNLVINQRNAG